MDQVQLINNQMVKLSDINLSCPQPDNNYIQKIPDEILLILLRYTDPKKAELICRKFYNVTHPRTLFYQHLLQECSSIFNLDYSDFKRFIECSPSYNSVLAERHPSHSDLMNSTGALNYLRADVGIPEIEFPSLDAMCTLNNSEDFLLKYREGHQSAVDVSYIAFLKFICPEFMQKIIETNKLIFTSDKAELRESTKFLRREVMNHPNVYQTLTKYPVEEDWESQRLPSESLTPLPEEIGNLIHLTSCSLRKSRLSLLTRSFCTLTNLVKCDLGENGLKFLPKSFSTLANLTYCCLHANKLISLPASIGNLTKLKHLDLSFNQFETLPESMSRLSGLSLLDLTNNPYFLPKPNGFCAYNQPGAPREFMSRSSEKFFNTKITSGQKIYWKKFFHKELQSKFPNQSNAHLEDITTLKVMMLATMMIFYIERLHSAK